MSRKEVMDKSIACLLPHLDRAALAGKHLFVTGGTGFFGHWLLHTLGQLHDSGLPLSVTVLSRDPDFFLEKFPIFHGATWLKFLRGDVTDFDFPDGQFDLLIHAATDTSRKAHKDSLSIFNAMVEGARHVLDFAVHARVKRALLVSSGAVYGHQPATVPQVAEESSMACPSDVASSAYGEGKRVMELLGAAYQQKFGLAYSVARCFAFVGPGLPLDQHFAIGNFIRDALADDEIRVHGDGSAVRSYLYGADLAVWLLEILLNGQCGRTYNVGSDQAISIRDLAQQVANVLVPGKRVQIQNAQAVKNDLRSFYVPSILRARSELKLDVWTPLSNAIRWSAAYAMAKQ